MKKNNQNVVEKMNSAFATHLRELMEENNDTQQGLAEVVGGTRQLISQYRNGDILPNADKIIKIAKYYNVSTDYLLGLTDAKRTDSLYVECLELKVKKMLERQKKVIKEVEELLREDDRT